MKCQNVDPIAHRFQFNSNSNLHVLALIAIAFLHANDTLNKCFVFSP